MLDLPKIFILEDKNPIIKEKGKKLRTSRECLDTKNYRGRNKIRKVTEKHCI